MIFPFLIATMVITPEVALIDQETSVKLNNLNPNEIIEIRAEAKDDNNIIWSSYGLFKSDENGTIDLSIHAPIEGTYSGVDPMGIFWSMKSERGHYDFIFLTRKDKLSIKIKALIDKEEVASKTIVRLIKSEDIKNITIKENGLNGTLFLPPSEKPLPVIIVLSGSGGGIMKEKSQLLASHGFAVFALGYFGMEGLPETLQNIPLEYFEKAFQWIKSQPYLDGSNIGIMGGSRGGELALILGSLFPESVQAIVSVVPSSVIYGGENQDIMPLGHAWLYQGKPLAPFAPQSHIDNRTEGKDISNPFKSSPSFLEGMKEKEAFQASFIPVEKIKAPLLLISGGDDQMWPSATYAFQIEEQLRKCNSDIFWQHLYYPKAGHHIAMPFVPWVENICYDPIYNLWRDVGGSKSENYHACQDSWKKLISFFDKFLKI